MSNELNTDEVVELIKAYLESKGFKDGFSLDLTIAVDGKDGESTDVFGARQCGSAHHFHAMIKYRIQLMSQPSKDPEQPAPDSTSIS